MIAPRNGISFINGISIFPNAKLDIVPAVFALVPVIIYMTKITAPPIAIFMEIDIR